ncbi:SIMPL domain-containing protein [Actinomadura verrucosospora]|uniref:Uncharacterized protein n=1 Tax=Actinomadura verrucosospora TaxID=46165 RepID=A0A7D3VZC4_ACTVE|nr:SIMPL domain-containing protein [Actinomadura verrucosospora]QKG24754.1 hypothetical protein ACTIVE_6403 [Actinomadura verrucosospora]
MSEVPQVRLRTYRLARKAYLRGSGGELALRLPAYFGRRLWRVPMAEVNVVDLTSPRTVVQKIGDVYAEPVVTPYLPTTGPLTRPTTLLLFTTPQRVPPLRWLAAIAPNSSLPFGYRASRSAKGARLDGVFLRAADPGDAADRLVAAGAQRVDDPALWLREHRKRVADPVRADAIALSEKRARAIGTAAGASLILTLVTVQWASDHHGPDWLWLIAAIAGTATALLTLVALRAQRRARKAGSA